MDQRTRTRVSMIVAVVAVAVGLAVFLTQNRTAGRPPITQSEATGVVVAVDSAGLDDVRGFTLRVAGGELLEFSLRELEDRTAFPPGHLAEHQATAEPVTVYYRMDGNERLALRLVDAPR